MRKYKFPSAYKRLVTDSFRDTVFYDGKYYLIGKDAETNGMAIWDIPKMVDVTPLFLKYLQDVKKEDISKVVLSVPSGVFAEAFKQKKQGRRCYFDEVKEKVKGKLKDVEEVKFLPQGVSAIYVYMQDKRLKEGDVVLTIDGGFNTLNLALTVVGTPLDIVYNESLFDKGIRQLLLEYFYPLLVSEISYDIKKDYHFLKDIFLSKEIAKGFDIINVSSLVEEAVKNYVTDLKELIYEFLSRNNIKNYDAINVVGGISYYLQNAIKTDKKLFLPEKDGEFLTAIGMAVKNPGFLAVDLGFGDVKVAKNKL